jgi:hypothetical protein
MKRVINDNKMDLKERGWEGIGWSKCGLDQQ